MAGLNENMGTGNSQIAGLLKEATELHRQNKLKQAQALYRKVLQLQPNNVNALHLLGSLALQVREYRPAAELIGRALQLAPDVVPYHCNYAEALRGLGDAQGALASYDKALVLDPGFALAHLKRGELLWSAGQHEAALTGIARATELAPQMAEAWHVRGSVLKQAGRLPESLAALQKALEIDPAHEAAATAVGSILLAQNRFDAARKHFQGIVQKFPDRVLAKLGQAKALKRLVPEWHVPMMNDSVRNDAYDAALRSVVEPGKLVLEIGTGAGLLAMMAARAGAQKVVTCETEAALAEVARQIVADNGLAGVIEVLAKPSTRLVIGEDLPEKADILVSEIFSSELLAEYVLPSIEDARKRLVKDNAAIIPANGTVMIALCGGEDIGRNVWVDQVSGFDLRSFNTLNARKKPLFRADLKPALLSPAIEALHFDFVKDSVYPKQKRSLDLTVTDAGLCYGIIQWIRFELVPGVVYENHPLHDSLVSGWQHCVYLFDEPLLLESGDTVEITAEHDRNSPWFEFSGHLKPAT